MIRIKLKLQDEDAILLSAVFLSILIVLVILNIFGFFYWVGSANVLLSIFQLFAAAFTLWILIKLVNVRIVKDADKKNTGGYYGPNRRK